MKYIIKVAHDSNPQRENAQFLGVIDLPNEEDDSLITDICDGLDGTRDCTFYYESCKISQQREGVNCPAQSGPTNKQSTPCDHVGSFLPISNIAKCDKCGITMYVK